MFSHVDRYGLSKPRALLLPAILVVLLAFFILIKPALAVTFNNPLIDAAEVGDAALVKKLLEQGGSPDSKGDFGTTAIMRAAVHGNTEIIKILIKKGAAVNAADVGGETALHLAAKNGYAETVKFLLKKGASVDIQDKEQWTPIMRATVSKHPDVVKILIENGADVSAVNNINESVIINAAKAGSTDIMKIIIGSPKSAKITNEQRAMSMDIVKKNENESLKKILADFINKKQETKIVSKVNTEKVQPEKIQPEVIKPTVQKKEVIEKKEVAEANVPTPVVKAPVPAKENLKDTKDTKVAIKKPAVKKKQVEVLPWLAANKPSGKTIKLNKAVASKEPAIKTLPWLTNSNGDTKILGEGARKIAENKLPNVSSIAKNSDADSVFFVQLGSFRDDKSAEKEWGKIISSNADILSKFEPNIVNAIAPGDISYKLRAGSIATKSEADSVCKAIKNRKLECDVVEVANKIDDFIVPANSQKPSKEVEPSKMASSKNKSSTAMKADTFMGNYQKIGEEAILPTAPLPVPMASLNLAPLDMAATVSSPSKNESAVPNKSLPWHSTSAPIRTEWNLPEEEVVSSEVVVETIKPSPDSYDMNASNKDKIRNAAQAQARTKKEYDEFYKEVKDTDNSPKVSEAIPVPDETYFVNKKQSTPVNIASSSENSGTWINIEKLPSEAFANDYGDRMFKYDESLGNIQIIVNKPTKGSVTMKVGPLPENRAAGLCDTVRTGGFGCGIVEGAASSTYSAAAPASVASSAELSEAWISLGTFASTSEAEYYKLFVQEDNSDLLGSLRYEMAESKDSNEYGAVQLRTGPLDSKQRASQICNILRNRNVACVVVD